MPRRVRTYRQRVDGEWVTLYCEQFVKTLWNIGASIHPSRRAQNDWYYNKQNKRSRSAAKRTKLRGIKGVRILYTMLKRALKELPQGHHVMIMIDHGGSNAMGRYAERLGFTFHPGDTKDSWVLVDLGSQEDLPLL